MKIRREPYAKLYASWHAHPRTGPLSLAASGLEARMMSWSVAHGTNGSVPRESVSTCAPSAKAKEIAAALVELVARGVLVEHPEGYVIRDFLDANISKERDEQRRANQVERQNRSRGHTSVTRDANHVTRDRSVSHTPSLDHDHDHDGGEAPPPTSAEPPETILRDVVCSRWTKTYQTHRNGDHPARDIGSAREVVTWLRANASNLGRLEPVLLDDMLAAYWREPWPLDRANRPSLANLLRQLDRLRDELSSTEPSITPDAYDPRKHGDLGHLGGLYETKHNLLLDVGPKRYDDALAQRRAS